MWLSYFEFLKKLLQSEPGSDCSILSCSNLNICFGTIVTGFSFNRICVFLRNISLTFYLEIRTRFRFKIIIRYYSFFSYTILYIFFKKSIFTQLEPGSDCSILPCPGLNVCSDVIGTRFRFIKIS